MLRQTITPVSLDSVRQQSQGRKVLFFQPWPNYRSFFLSYFLDNAREGVLYHRIPASDGLKDWFYGLLASLDQLPGGFGRQTRPLLEAERLNDLGPALSADLAAFSPEPLLLLIDDFERVAHEEVSRRLLRSLIDTLPANVQLAFSSKLLNAPFYRELVQCGEAVVLETEKRRTDTRFVIQHPLKPQLEIHAFGKGAALVDGQEITQWDGALPRQLFFYFIENPLATRDEIFDAFWPNLSVKEATNVFHVTKRKVAECITARVRDGYGNYELTQYVGGFYMPAEKLIRHYDVTDFQEAVELALVAADDRKEEQLFSRALDLYKAPFLETVRMPWAEQRRQQLQKLYAQALIGMGRLHQRRENSQRALNFYVRALKEAPEREDIHRDVMKLYLGMGMVSHARTQYTQLESYLQTTLGVEPSLETREVFEHIAQRS